MKKINVMLIRDLKIFKFQIIAAVIIIFAGITLFASSVMSFKNLEFSKDKFYSTNNFLDYYTVGSNLNNEELKEVQELKEVKEAEGRLELEASLKISSNENIFARIVAINGEPKVNKLKYVEGNFIKNKDEVLLSKSFCKYHKLAIGDKVKIKVLNSEKEYIIAGIVESPEFIYTVKSREYIMPSIEDYTIVYMEIEEIMEKMKVEEAVYNQFHVTLKDGYKYEDVKDKTKDIIGEKFITEVERKDQISEVMLREDIGMIAEIAYMFPVLLLSLLQ